jgi:hypothetical protein
MKQVKSVSVSELKTMAENMYGNIVKAVVDIGLGLVVVDAPMHVDQEQYLLENGSRQSDLWGINLHPAKYGTDDFIEYDSMINIRPRVGNMSRGVNDPDVQELIKSLIAKVVHE